MGEIQLICAEDNGSQNAQRYSVRPLRVRRAVLGIVLTFVALSVSCEVFAAARAPRRQPQQVDRGRIYRFLVSNGVPIDSKIRVAKLNAVLKTRYQVRSIVKIVGPDRVPNPEDVEELRKIIRRKQLQGVPTRLDFSKKPDELDLLRQSILSGEVMEFHPSEKLGELELFFSEEQSLKIEIGNDMFYIRIGNNDCTFESRSLRKQLKSILEPREVRASETTKSRSRRGRSSR